MNYKMIPHSVNIFGSLFYIVSFLKALLQFCFNLEINDSLYCDHQKKSLVKSLTTKIKRTCEIMLILIVCNKCVTSAQSRHNARHTVDNQRWCVTHLSLAAPHTSRRVSTRRIRGSWNAPLQGYRTNPLKVSKNPDEHFRHMAHQDDQR